MRIFDSFGASTGELVAGKNGSGIVEFLYTGESNDVRTYISLKQSVNGQDKWFPEVLTGQVKLPATESPRKVTVDITGKVPEVEPGLYEMLVGIQVGSDPNHYQKIYGTVEVKKASFPWAWVALGVVGIVLFRKKLLGKKK